MNIALQNITKSYGEKAVLAGFSAQLERGKTLCLFGESGCGKTTLARILAGLEEDFEGEIKGAENLKISMVFQENRLMSWLTAAGNIRFAAPNADAEEILKKLGLEGCADKYQKELSGGMARRVAIARAAAYGGDILILDEPYKGLDRAAAESSAKLLAERFRDGYILLITHDPYEAAKSADRVIFMKNGAAAESLSFDIPPENRTEQNAEEYAAKIKEAARI